MGRDPRVDEYIDPLPEWQAAICREVRDLVHSADPEVGETIKRRVQPYFVLEGNICALLATRDHVNVFLYEGAIVADPEGIITAGHGNKTARTVAVYEGEKVPAAPLKAMFEQIIANNRAGGWRKLRSAEGALKGSFERPLRPAESLFEAALREVPNGLLRSFPSGPGALLPPRCPSDRPLSAPAWACRDIRGKRNARMARTTHNAMTAAISKLVSSLRFRPWPTRDTSGLDGGGWRGSLGLGGRAGEVGGADLGEAAVAAQRHRQVELRQDHPQHRLHAGLPLQGETPEGGAAEQQRVGTKRQRLEDVGAAAHA